MELQRKDKGGEEQQALPQTSEAGEMIQIPEKSFLKKLTPVFAAGAGLFSDGYVKNYYF